MAQNGPKWPKMARFGPLSTSIPYLAAAHCLRPGGQQSFGLRYEKPGNGPKWPKNKKIVSHTVGWLPVGEFHPGRMAYPTLVPFRANPGN